MHRHRSNNRGNLIAQAIFQRPQSCHKYSQETLANRRALALRQRSQNCRLKLGKT